MAAIRKFSTLDAVSIAAVCLCSVVGVLPFAYVACVSLTDPSAYVPMTLTLIPKKLSFVVYRYILSTPAFLDALKSTIIITVGGTTLNIFVTFTMAYAMTKKGLPLRKAIMGLVVFGLLFDVGIIPNYLLVKGLGLINTYWSIILPVATDSWSLIVAISFLNTIPAELEESAKIDGCSDIRIFIRIILPLATAALATLTLFFAVGQWNVYIKPMMYLNDSAMMTLQVYVKSLLVDGSVGGSGSAAAVGLLEDDLPSETIRMATVVLAMLPIMAVYPFLQRYFMKGVMLGSIKG